MRLMAISQETALPADVEAAYALLVDEVFLADYATATGALSYDVTVDGSRTRLQREMPTDQVPSAMRGFVGDRLPIVETCDWAGPAGDGSRTAAAVADIRVGGRAVTFTGTIALVPAGTGAVYRAIGDVEVKIPLIGGRLKGPATDAVAAALRQQAQLLAERLA